MSELFEGEIDPEVLRELVEAGMSPEEIAAMTGAGGDGFIVGDDDGFEIVGGDGTDGSPFEVAWEGGELVIGDDGTSMTPEELEAFLAAYGGEVTFGGQGDGTLGMPGKMLMPLGPLKGHEHRVSNIKVYSDPGDGLEIGTGTTLITSSHDRTVRVWVIDGGDESFSPEEASVDALAAGRNTQTIQFDIPVHCVAISPSKKHLYCGLDDGTLAAFLLIPGEDHLVEESSRMDFQVTQVAIATILFSREDEQTVFCGCDDHCVHVVHRRFDETFEEVALLEGHTDEIYALLEADGMVLSAGGDGMIRMWRCLPKTGESGYEWGCVASVQAHQDGITDLAADPFGNIWSCSWDGQFKSYRMVQLVGAEDVSPEGDVDTANAVYDLMEERVYEVEAPIQSMTLGAVANRNGAPLALMLLRSFNDISVIVLEQDSEGDLEVLPLGIEPDDFTSVIALDSQGHVYTCAQQEFVNPALLDDEGGIIEDVQAEWVAQVNARAEVFGLEEGRSDGGPSADPNRIDPTTKFDIIVFAIISDLDDPEDIREAAAAAMGGSTSGAGGGCGCSGGCGDDCQAPCCNPAPEAAGDEGDALPVDEAAPATEEGTA